MTKLQKKRSCISKFFRFLLLSFLLTVLLLLVLFSVFYANYNSILKTLFQRELEISVNHIDWAKGIFEWKKIRWKDGEMVLASAEKILIQVDYRETFLLRPALKKLLIDTPVVFVEKKEDGTYELPAFLPGKKKGTEVHLEKIPYRISETVIVNGLVQLKEGRIKTPLITELELVIPPLDFNAEGQNLKPGLSMKVNGRKVVITGETVFHEEYTTLRLDVILSRLDLNQIAYLIPPLGNLRIGGGTVSSDIRLEYMKKKNGWQTLTLNGSAASEGLRLNYLNGEPFIRQGSIQIELAGFDVMNQKLDVRSLEASSVQVNILPEKFSGKTLSKKFSYLVNRFTFRKLSVNLPFLPLSASGSGLVSNFNNRNNDRFNYEISAETGEIVQLTSSGSISNRFNEFYIDKMTAKKAALHRIPWLKLDTEKIRELTLSDLDGSAVIAGEEKVLSGKITVSKFDYLLENPRKLLSLEDFSVSIRRYDLTSGLLEIDFFKLNKARIPVTETRSIDNLTLESGILTEPYRIPLKKEKGVSFYSFTSPLRFEKIEMDWVNGEPFNLSMDQIRLNPDLRFLTEEKKLEGSFELALKNGILTADGKPSFKLSDAHLTADEFHFPDLTLFIPELTLKASYAGLTVDENRRLLLFNRFDLFKKSPDKKQPLRLNILSSTVSIDRIAYVDRSFAVPFNYDLTGVETVIRNFPSTVYPSGTLALTGKMNNRNSFRIECKIGTDTGLDGKFTTENLRITDWSPYLEKFTGYEVTAGQASIQSDFRINAKEFILNTSLLLNRMRLRNIKDQSGINLNRIVEQIEDADNNIRISVPVKGDPAKPDIDYYRIFFSLFYDAVANSATPLNQKKEKLSPAGMVDLINFKGGTADFTETPVLSEKLESEIKNPGRRIVIEGYVDRGTDSEYMKRSLLKERLSYYSKSSEEIPPFIKVYEELYGSEPSADTDTEQIEKLILDRLTVTERVFYTLSYQRAEAVRKWLVENRGVVSSRIIINENNIFSNPYFTGMPQTFAVVFTVK